MSSITSLVFLSLMVAACSYPVSQCKAPCTSTQYHQPDFRHISELSDTSFAPWELKTVRKAGREPEAIDFAVCKPCSDPSLKAEQILIEVSVYEKNGSQYCKCPYELAVGCTCVKK